MQRGSITLTKEELNNLLSVLNTKSLQGTQLEVKLSSAKDNNEDKVARFAATLSKYAPRLRGFTCYPDGSRGGQPLTSVPYAEALAHKDTVYDEVIDLCDITKGGVCGS